MTLGRGLAAILCLLALGGCAKDTAHPPYASGACATPPCGGPIDRTMGVPADASAPDAADARD